MMLSLTPLAIRNSLRSPRRSVLTILTIAVSFCAIGVLMALYSLFFLSNPAPDQALRLIVRNRISFANPLPASYSAKIKALPGVREVMIQQWFGGAYKDARQPGNNFARFAIEPEKLFRLHPEYAIASWQIQNFLRRRDACILGRALAERLGVKLGDRVTLLGDIFPARIDLVVAGFYESAIDNEVLYFNNRYLKESLRKEPDYAIMLMVMVDRLDLVTPVGRRIDDLFRNSSAPTKTETEKAFRLNFLNYLGDIKLFLFAVCASLAGTVMLAAANAIAMSVRERAQEAGILKALGFSAQAVLFLFAGEALLLGALGGVAGLFLAEALLAAMRNLPVVMVSLTTLSLSPGAMILQVSLAAFCALAAAVPSAWRAGRRPISECLRQAD